MVLPASYILPPPTLRLPLTAYRPSYPSSQNIKMSATRFASVPVLLKARKLRRVPMVADGNCFYRAVAAAFYNNTRAHESLRHRIMDYMLEMEDIYTALFESPRRFRAVLAANKRLGVWNSDLADIAPFAAANLLQVRLEVFSVCEGGEVARYIFNESQTGLKVRLLHEDNHYDVLLR